MKDPTLISKPLDVIPNPTETINFSFGEFRNNGTMGSNAPIRQYSYIKGQKKNGNWAVAWSDLMMTMFILFLVLFIYASTKRDFKVKNIKPSPLEGLNSTEKKQATKRKNASISDVYTRSRKVLKPEYIQGVASVDLIGDTAVKIVLPGDLLFDTGQADLKTGAKKTLREIAEIIRFTPHMVNIAGHTDNVPIRSERYSTNWELSAVRACVVARFLIEDMRISQKRFFITGHSYNRPVKQNTTYENRTRNRRVEIIITREIF